MGGRKGGRKGGREGFSGGESDRPNRKSLQNVGA